MYPTANYTWSSTTSWSTWSPTIGWPTTAPTEPQPTHSLTPYPTLATTPTPTCINDESRFQINLQEDYYGYETSIAVFALNDDYTDLDSSVYFQSSFESVKLHNVPLCLETDRCYLFAIHDSYGGGLTAYSGYFLICFWKGKI